MKINHLFFTSQKAETQFFVAVKRSCTARSSTQDDERHGSHLRYHNQKIYQRTGREIVQHQSGGEYNMILNTRIRIVAILFLAGGLLVLPAAAWQQVAA